MTPEVYAYFSNPNNFNAMPNTRGVAQDLHLALESNNLTQGWMPRHPVKLWHYTKDTVVPYVNAESAYYKLGSYCMLTTPDESWYQSNWDHVGGGRVFFTGMNLGAAENELLEIILQ